MGKKIMILGVGEAQLNLIHQARAEGYFIVICDMRSESEGAKLADKFYKVNYTEKEAVLEVALREEIDGIISNSEPAMPTVAYVSEKLNLLGNSIESIETLLSKTDFRKLQRNCGVFAPKAYNVDSLSELLETAQNMKFPVIIKPTKSSGTRGTSKIEEYSDALIEEAFEICREFSRDGSVTIEEYVEMLSLTINNADIFVLNDKILWDGWHCVKRSEETPMLPMTHILPVVISEAQKQKIVDTVTTIIKASGIKLGEYNVETYFTKDDDVFVIEINPRQAGNNIPQLIKEHTGVDLTRLLVTTAVNDMSYYNELKIFKRECNYITHQVVFSKKDGVYAGLHIDENLKKYMQWCNEVVSIGDSVKRGLNAADCVAYIEFKFDDLNTQLHYTEDMEKYVYPLLQ
ncbi:MAG: ATP-grasp domain-containing protein [Oscillospiraceae bacterium]|nr:ATP-grasp domain-containing protein [Oscillospiraceae bacterium]